MPTKNDSEEGSKRVKDKVSKKILKEEKEEKKDKGIGHVQWVFLVLFLAIILSTVFSVITELIYSSMGNNLAEIIVASVVVLIIVLIAILSDMVGVAATSCDIEPFHAMASRKVQGAKKAVELCQNADKVSSIIADIIGDVCGIISGASGATISFVVLEQFDNVDTFLSILVSAAIAALIAGITIAGKAICKRIAVENSHGIVFALAKFLSVFDKKDK